MAASACGFPASGLRSGGVNAAFGSINHRLRWGLTITENTSYATPIQGIP